MSDLQHQALSLVLQAGPEGVSLDDLASTLSEGTNRSRGNARAQARDLLRRLGAEGLIESVDAGETWRGVEG